MVTCLFCRILTEVAHSWSQFMWDPQCQPCWRSRHARAHPYPCTLPPSVQTGWLPTTISCVFSHFLDIASFAVSVEDRKCREIGTPQEHASTDDWWEMVYKYPSSLSLGWDNSEICFAWGLSFSNGKNPILPTVKASLILHLLLVFLAAFQSPHSFPPLLPVLSSPPKQFQDQLLGETALRHMVKLHPSLASLPDSAPHELWEDRAQCPKMLPRGRLVALRGYDLQLISSFFCKTSSAQILVWMSNP